MRVCVKFHSSELVTPLESHNERIVQPPPPPATGCTVRGTVQRHQQGSYGLLCIICHMSLVCIICHMSLCYVLFVTCHSYSRLLHGTILCRTICCRETFGSSQLVCARACVRACVYVCACACAYVFGTRAFLFFLLFITLIHPFLVVSQILKRECAGCGV